MDSVIISLKSDTKRDLLSMDLKMFFFSYVVKRATVYECQFYHFGHNAMVSYMCRGQKFEHK